MQDHAGDQHRPPRPHLERVRLRPRAVDHRHRPLAEHLEHAVGRDHRGGVLVDADAELAGGLGHQQQQTAQPVSLGEVLVDHRPGQQPEPGGHVGQALLGHLPGTAEGHHVGAERAGARRGAADDGAAPVGGEQGRAEPGPGHHHRQPELVAAGHEHPGRAGDLLGGGGRLGLLAGAWPQRAHLGRAQLDEDPLVQAGQLVAERGRGGEHDDAGAVAAGEPHEVAQDRPVAELVLRATDGHEDAGAARGGIGGHRGSLATGTAYACLMAPRATISPCVCLSSRTRPTWPTR